MENPFSVTSHAPLEEGVFGEHADREAGTFLYRVIQIRHPLPCQFVYSGWWFKQKIEINGIRVWSQISWLWIRNNVEFRLPGEVDADRRAGRLEIDFSRGLRIRRFRLWIGDEQIYDEVS